MNFPEGRRKGFNSCVPRVAFSFWQQNAPLKFCTTQLRKGKLLLETETLPETWREDIQRATQKPLVPNKAIKYVTGVAPAEHQPPLVFSELVAEAVPMCPWKGLHMAFKWLYSL